MYTFTLHFNVNFLVAKFLMQWRNQEIILETKLTVWFDDCKLLFINGLSFDFEYKLLSI